MKIGTMIRVGLQTFDADTGNPVVLVAKVPFESNIGNEVMVSVDSQHIEFIDGRFIGNQGTLISFLDTNFTVNKTAIL